MAYSTESDWGDYYGAANVTLWASHTGSETSGQVTTRVGVFISYADAIIDAQLGNSKASNVLSLGTVPTVVKLISVLLGGGLLYKSWGVRDTQDKDRGMMHENWELGLKLLEKVASGEWEVGL